MSVDAFATEGLQCLAADLAMTDGQTIATAGRMSGKPFYSAETARVWLACSLFQYMIDQRVEPDAGWEALRKTPEYDAFLDSCFKSRVSLSTTVVRLLEHARALAKQLSPACEDKVAGTLEFFEAGLEFEKDAALARARARAASI